MTPEKYTISYICNRAILINNKRRLTRTSGGISPSSTISSLSSLKAYNALFLFPPCSSPSHPPANYIDLPPRPHLFHLPFFLQPLSKETIAELCSVGWHQLLNGACGTLHFPLHPVPTLVYCPSPDNFPILTISFFLLSFLTNPSTYLLSALIFNYIFHSFLSCES